MQIAYKDDLRHRLHRITGQVEGITRMMEEERYCVDILVQISAVRGALNQVALNIIENHTKGCVKRSIRAGDEEQVVEELMDVLRKLVK